MNTSEYGRATFYCGNGTVFDGRVPLPPPRTVNVRVSIIPPPDDPRFWTMASDERLFRLASVGDLNYEPCPDDGPADAEVDAFVYVNEDAAIRLHDGRLSGAALADGLLGPRAAWKSIRL